MARPVKVTTPIPTLDEFGDELGISKTRRKSLGPIFVERRPKGYYAVRRHGSPKAINVLPTQREAVDLAREISPSGRIFVERVRDTSGIRDKWRKV
jgi:hypothetical protein